MKSHSVNIILLIAFGICIFLQNFFAVITVLVIAILALEYSLFYTHRPKVLWVFLIAGIAIAGVNLYESQPTASGIFIGVVFIECIRVFVMALLRYPSTINELKELTEQLEKRVEQRTEELSSANQKLSDTNQQLNEANDELKQLDQMKSAFVSQASHDLRTPLTAIKGSLDNLLLGIAGEMNEKQTKVLNRAIRSVDRLTDLINDVLDLNRIETGRVVLDKKEYSLRDSIQNIIAEHRPAADQKQIQITFEKDEDPFPICADAGKMDRVIGELIGNAIKYTKDQGIVSIKLKNNHTNVSVSVHDNGVGLPADACEKIWERFYRVPETQHSAKGSGLGLSIAKEIIEMHNGTITVESRLGEGTTFTVSLPVYSPENRCE